MSHVVSHVISWRARGHVIGHVTGRSHLITCVLTVTCVLTITCASDEQVRHSSEKSRRRLLGIRWNSPSSGLGSHPSSHLPGLADRCAAPVTPVTKHLGNTCTRDQPYRPGRCWYSAHRYISF